MDLGNGKIYEGKIKDECAKHLQSQSAHRVWLHTRKSALYRCFV